MSLESEVHAEIDERIITKAAAESATKSLQNLCAIHAPTFVAVERRGAVLASSLSHLISAVDFSENQVSECRNWLEGEESGGFIRLTELGEGHRLRRRTLVQHGSLVELLELASLMDACIRSKLYDEALSVAGFANTLESRHLKGGEKRYNVVKSVVSEVRSREGELRRHLLQRLRSELSMADCLEVVTALRRLNAVQLERAEAEQVDRLHSAMELRLQVDFFEARDHWLDSPAAPSSSSFNDKQAQPKHKEHLLDCIERHRTRCFEIATQFSAVFRPNQHRRHQPLTLLSLWTTRRIQIFLATLNSHLALINDTASLRDALDATLFFATSMSRLGADFHPLLPTLFHPRLTTIITHHWETALQTLQKTLTLCRDAGLASPLHSSSTPNLDFQHDTSDPVIKSTPTPPKQILKYPPLATFLNSHLTALNELRRCLLLGTFQSLRTSLQTVLRKLQQILQVNERAVFTPGMKGEAQELREVAKEMNHLVETCLEPYCRLTLEVALGTFDLGEGKQQKEDTNEEEEEKEKEEGEEDNNFEEDGEDVKDEEKVVKYENGEEERKEDKEHDLEETSENEKDITEQEEGKEEPKEQENQQGEHDNHQQTFQQEAQNINSDNDHSSDEEKENDNEEKEIEKEKDHIEDKVQGHETAEG